LRLCERETLYNIVSPPLPASHSHLVLLAKGTLPSTPRLGATSRRLPFVDSSQSSRASHWSHAHLSTPPFAASQLQSIPTPPSSEAGRSSGPTRDTTANVAAAVAHPTSMHPGPAQMGVPPSFSSRRGHAAHLGNFELPPPSAHKFSSFNTINASQSSQAPTTIASVGNLLTPPNNIPGEVLTPSSGVSTSSAQPATMSSYNQSGGYMYSPASQPSSHYGYGAPQQNQYNQARGGEFPCLQTPSSLSSTHAHLLVQRAESATVRNEPAAAAIHAIVRTVQYASNVCTTPASPSDELTASSLELSTPTIARSCP
jgi:hypothetical protein